MWSGGDGVRLRAGDSGLERGLGFGAGAGAGAGALSGFSWFFPLLFRATGGLSLVGGASELFAPPTVISGLSWTFSYLAPVLGGATGGGSLAGSSGEILGRAWEGGATASVFW